MDDKTARSKIFRIILGDVLPLKRNGNHPSQNAEGIVTERNGISSERSWIDTERNADINGVSSRTVIRKMKNSQIKDFKHYGKINRAVIIGVHYMRFDKKMKLQAIADSFGLSRRTICTVVKMDITPHENAITNSRGKKLHGTDEHI